MHPSGTHIARNTPSDSPPQNAPADLLITAITRGHLLDMQTLLQTSEDLDVNASTAGDGATVLMVAAEHGHIDVVRYLVQQGANVNASNKNGATAFMYAAQKGDLQICECLVQLGADVNAANLHGNTALMAATHFEFESIVQLLLKNNVNVRACNNQGNTALMAAAESAQEQGSILRLLIENGGDVNASRVDGTTALMLAAMNQRHRAAQLLLEHGADVHAVNNVGQSALHFCRGPFHNMIRLLTEFGANIEATDRNGDSPLVAAAKDPQRNREDVRSLIGCGAATARAHGLGNMKTIIHDIAIGARIPRLGREAECSTNIITLRLTNRKNLTTMPLIRGLPSSVCRVELDESCSCITDMAYGFDTQGFLSQSYNLRFVEISALRQLSDFGSGFLCEANSLMHLTLPPTRAPVVSIGPHFLSRCSSLRSLDTSLVVTSSLCLEHDFLSNCPMLRSVDLTAMASVRHVPDRFLAGCRQLEAVDLEPLSNVDRIGEEFLYNANSLASVHLPFAECSYFGVKFMASCSTLQTVTSCGGKNNGTQHKKTCGCLCVRNLREFTIH